VWGGGQGIPYEHMSSLMGRHGVRAAVGEGCWETHLQASACDVAPPFASGMTRVPAGHTVQAMAPAALEKEPDGHSSHAALRSTAPVTPTTARIPAGQGVQTSVASIVAYVPSLQGSQALALDVAPLAPPRPCMPAGH
jgi:hypothetical protein